MDQNQDPKNKDKNISDDPEVGWMLRFKSGDPSGFLEILKRYEKPVINFSYKFLRDREAAEDVAQDVFLAVHRKASSYQPKGKLSTWIFAIAHNRCVDRVRKRKIMSFFSLDKLIENDPSVFVEKQEIEAAVQSAIIKLPAHQRTALLLAKYEDMELAEIAKVMTLSEGAVKQLLHRAKAHLKRELDRFIENG